MLCLGELTQGGKLECYVLGWLTQGGKFLLCLGELTQGGKLECCFWMAYTGREVCVMFG